MEPTCFTAVASDVLNLKLTPGNEIVYFQPHGKVTINTATNFSNPSFKASFNLSPGTVEVSVPPAKGGPTPINIAVLPDLSAFDAKLAIYPLDNGKFDFTMTKQHCCTKATYNYKSEKQQFTLTLDPKKTFGNITVGGNAVISSFDRFPACKGFVLVKGLTLRSCYVPDRNLICGAAFYNFGAIGPLCGISTGALLKYGLQEKKPDTVELYLKGHKKECHVSAILSAIAKKVEFHYSGKFNLSKSQLQLGTIAEVKFADKLDYDFKVGLKVNPPCNHNIHVVIDNKGKFDAKLSLAHCNKCNASAAFGVTLDKVCFDKDQLNPKFSAAITFNE